MKIQKNKVIIATLGTLATVSVTAAIAVPLVVTKVAEKKVTEVLGNFLLTDKGVRNSLAGKDKINYVALGDSLTAGYNGYLGKDYLSYADFLAKDLAKAGKLKSYRNFAESGATINDLQEMFSEEPSVINALKSDPEDKMDKIRGADLITLTIGSNDMLKIVTMFGIPYGQITGLLSGSGTAAGNPSRSSIFGIEDTLENFKNEDTDSIALVNSGTSVAKSRDIFNNGLDALFGALYGKQLTGMINLNWQLEPKLHDLIKRNLMVMVRDLHKIAPQAQIKFIFPEMPFVGLDSDIINKTLPDAPYSAQSYFENRFKALFRNALDYNFIDFVDTHDIFTRGVKSMLTSPDALTSRYGARFKTNIDQGDYETVISRSYMHNLADIHPTVLGHQEIGNALFESIASELGLSSADALSTYSLANNNNGASEDWENLDEINFSGPGTGKS